MDIRLRLIIRRHGLPEVKLVWPCPASDDLTIASLLAQVNDVVVLESGQWGLEDYAVELVDGSGYSFECLHFQPVRKVFKQDDQVLIRSLLTEDIKQRRASGRHQISNDGIHLVDGIPFGRRRAPPGRPQLELPPRKRARLVYDRNEDEEDVEEEESPEGLFIEDTPRESQEVDGFRSIPHDPSDMNADEDDEADRDYTIDNDAEIDGDDDIVEEDDDLDEEIRLLQADNDIVGDHFFDSEEYKPQPELPPLSSQANRTPNNQPLLQEIAPAAVNALKSAFPFVSASAIRDALQKHRTDIHHTYRDLANKNDPAISFDEVLKSFLSERFANTKSSPEPSLLPETSKPQSRPLIQVVESEGVVDHGSPAKAVLNVVGGDAVGSRLDSADASSNSDNDSSSSDDASLQGQEEGDSDDSDGVSSDNGSDDLDMVTTSGASLSRTGRASEEESSSSGTSSDSEAGSHSVPGPASLNSNTQHDRSAPRDVISMLSSGVEDSESSDYASSESDERGTSSPRADKHILKKPTIEVDSSSDDSDSSDESSSSDDGEDSEEASSDSDSSPDELSAKRPPSNTASGPRRGAQAETAPRPQATVPRGQGLTKTQKRNARRKLAKQHAKAARAQASLPEVDELAARKKALLNALSQDADTHLTSEGMSLDRVNTSEVDKSPGPQDPAEWVDISRQIPTELNPVGIAGNTDAPAEKPVDMTNKAAASEVASPSDAPRRRAKMDKDAGRRLLFGALGLKNPKSKADEEKIREKLMKDVRPLKNHRHEETAQQECENLANGEEDDNEDWRTRITYRAVECCHEGMQLSEPPFPFVQRWDPQQQSGAMRKRKRQSQEYHEDYTYADDYGDDSYNYGGYEETGTIRKSKKTKKKSKHNDQANESVVDNHNELDYDDTPKKNMAGESQITDSDDLPPLPPDVTALAPLTLDMVTSGMVICWKELQMSKATSWQPTMALVTALVISVEDSTIHAILAKRDRPKDNRQYDETTGKRIYDKFEAPCNSDDDMEDDPEDEGHRWVKWLDMVEPRMVQSAPSLSIGNSSGPETSFSDKQLLPGEPTVEAEPAQANAGVDKDAVDREDDIPSASSIPSGQIIPRFEPPSASALDNTAVSSKTDDSQAQSASDGMMGQAPQSPQAMVKDPQPPGVVDESTQISGGEHLQGQPGQPLSAAYEDSALAEDSNPSVNVTSASPGQEPNKDRQRPVVEYPQLPSFLSSAGSLHSGRQPNPDDEILNETGDGDDTVIHHDIGPPDNEAHTDEGREVNKRIRGSSSPLPSLDDIWHTATTTKSSQWPVKSSQLSVLPKGKGAKSGCEEAMQRLGEGKDSDVSPDRNKSIRSLFPHATQPLPALDLPADSSLANPRKGKCRQRTSPFRLPRGSQVIEVDSSPVSPRPVEHYTNDGIGEPYHEKDQEGEQGSSPPHSSGWVEKNKLKGEFPRPNKGLSKAPSSSPAAGTRSKTRSMPWPSSASPAVQSRRRMSKKF